MTIEVYIQPEDADEPTHVRGVVPGEIMSMSDYSSGNREVLSAQCWTDDRGGDVYRFDNIGFPENGPYRVIPAEEYTLERREAVIGYGRSYEQHIVLESRRAARLILRHVPG